MHQERHQPSEDPRGAGRDREVARETPPAEQEHGDHEQPDGPQRRELVEDQEQGAGAGGDGVVQPHDRLLGRGGVVRVQDQRDEQERGDDRAGEVAGTAARRAFGALARRDVAQVGQQRTHGAHLPPLHATPYVTLVSPRGGVTATSGLGFHPDWRRRLPEGSA